jgi:hypothetical protein
MLYSRTRFIVQNSSETVHTLEKNSITSTCKIVFTFNSVIIVIATINLKLNASHFMPS